MRSLLGVLNIFASLLTWFEASLTESLPRRGSCREATERLSVLSSGGEGFPGVSSLCVEADEEFSGQGDADFHLGLSGFE